MQRFAVYLSLATVLTLACLVPMGFAAPMDRAGDVILLIYLLTVCGICTLLAGLAAGSTYSLVGISREMTSMIVLERYCGRVAHAIVPPGHRAGWSGL
jgi:formate hydrogenlyase subunit 4